MKNQAEFFLCGSLHVYFANLVARKPAFLHHLWGNSKQNYQALFGLSLRHRIRTEFMIFQFALFHS